MLIERVEPFLLSDPLAEPLRLTYHGGERTILKRDALLVRVTADNGLSGWAPGVADERTADAIRTTVSAALVGRDPLRWREIGFDASPAFRVAQIATLDLVGRYEGCTLTDLIGPRVRDSIALYASGGMYQPPEGYAREASAAASMGFRAYKLRPGGGPDLDVATVEAVRAATDIEVMVDAHTWWRMGDADYSFDTVLELANAFATSGIAWLEEPLPPADHAAYRRLRAAGPVPVASGEHEPDVAGLIEVATTGVADYVQADLCSHGGLALGEELFGTVRDSGARFAFHSWGTTMEVLVAAHLGVCWPETVVPWLEYPLYANGGRTGMYPFPLADEVLADGLDIRDGCLHVPTGPGLGLVVDERVTERYPYRPGPWSTFRLHSPATVLSVVGDHSVTGVV